MVLPKLPSSGAIYSGRNSGGHVYVIGGTIDQTCERYSVSEDTWMRIPSFKKNVGVGNGLFSYAMIMSTK